MKRIWHLLVLYCNIWLFSDYDYIRAISKDPLPIQKRRVETALPLHTAREGLPVCLGGGMAEEKKAMDVQQQEEEEEKEDEQVPDMAVVQLAFAAQAEGETPKGAELARAVMATVEAKSMAPWYTSLCAKHPELWKQDVALLEKMKAKNEARLKEIQDAYDQAEKDGGGKFNHELKQRDSCPFVAKGLSTTRCFSQTWRCWMPCLTKRRTAVA
jgi:hypothetical protein